VEAIVGRALRADRRARRLGARRGVRHAGHQRRQYGHSLDAALGFIASRRASEVFDVYVGGRAMLAVPVGANNSPNASEVVAVTGVVGTAAKMGDHVRAFAEGGVLAAADGHDVFPRFDAVAVLGLQLKL
jgi:hypothetical protein